MRLSTMLSVQVCPAGSMVADWCVGQQWTACWLHGVLYVTHCRNPGIDTQFLHKFLTLPSVAPAN